MADPAQSAATPVPEEDDFELFGPSPGEASQPSNPGPQPVPTVGPQQAPQPVPQQAPVPPAVTTTVGLDPQLQQLMLNMMQMQQQTLQVMMARMDADERRRREAEAASAAVADPFGSTAAAGSPSAKATAPPPPASAGPSVHVGSNRAEKYLPALPTIDAPSMGKRRVKELEEYHRWCEVLASWLALIDDNYVNELRQAMVHNREIKQSEMSAPVASRGMRPGKAVKNEPNDAEPPRLTMTDKEVEKLNQSSSRNSHFAWLVDSGATCHVLSVASLSFYEVVKEHSGPLPVLMSASDTEMECLGLVDIRVKFGRLGPVVLQKVLVCQIGFNVISSWQASLSGWCSWFTATPGESCLMKQNGKGSWVWVPLETEARSWWAMAQEIGPARAKAKAKSKAGVPKGTPPKFGKEDDDTGDAMEVDRAKEKAHPNKHPQRALEVTPFKFLLRSACSLF
ncbi:unnamed protein product [Symbiodinium sp. CCMP2592]|nr:unnamed protein product [Symbiodinium sp. CCMP2592]